MTDQRPPQPGGWGPQPQQWAQPQPHHPPQGPPPAGYQPGYGPQPGYPPPGPPQQGHPQGYPPPGYAPAPPRRGLTGKRVAMIVAGVLVLALIAVGAVFAINRFGPVKRPADALPAEAAAYLELNLKPSGQQLLAAVRFVEKIPDLKRPDGRRLDTSSNDFKQIAFESVIEPLLGLEAVDYAEDVKPWLGDSIGLALVRFGDRTRLVVAVHVTKGRQGQSGVEDLLADSGRATGGLETELVNDWVVVGEADVVAEVASDVRAGRTLARATTFAADAGGFERGAILSLWADNVGLQELQRLSGTGSPAPVDESRVAVSLVMDPDFAELRGGITNMSTRQETKGTATDLLRDLPGDTDWAVASSDSQPYLDATFESLARQGEQSPWGNLERAWGLTQDDVRTMLGDRTVVAGTWPGGGTVTWGAVVTSGDVGGVEAAVKKAAEHYQGQCYGCDASYEALSEGDRFAMSPKPGYAGALLDRAEAPLRDRPEFTKAIPTKGSAIVAYVSLDGLRRSVASSGFSSGVPRGLSSAGFAMSLAGGGRATFSLRVVAA